MLDRQAAHFFCAGNTARSTMQTMEARSSVPNPKNPAAPRTTHQGHQNDRPLCDARAKITAPAMKGSTKGIASSATADVASSDDPVTALPPFSNHKATGRQITTHGTHKRRREASILAHPPSNRILYPAAQDRKRTRVRLRKSATTRRARGAPWRVLAASFSPVPRHARQEPQHCNFATDGPYWPTTPAFVNH